MTKEEEKKERERLKEEERKRKEDEKKQREEQKEEEKRKKEEERRAKKDEKKQKEDLKKKEKELKKQKKVNNSNSSFDNGTPSTPSDLNISGDDPLGGLSESELNENIEKMLNAIGAKEDIRVVVRSHPLASKYTLWKNWHDQSNDDNLIPAIEKLIERMNTRKDRETMQDVLVKLRNSTVAWVDAFIENGGVKSVNEILSSTNLLKKTKNKDDDTLQWLCLNCLRAILNTEKGLLAIAHDKSIFFNMALLLDSENIEIRIQCLFIFANFCSEDSVGDGYRIILSSLEHFKFIRREKQMFEFLVTSLENQLDISYVTHVIFLFNSLLTNADPTDTITLANQLNSLKAIEVIREQLQGKQVDDEGFQVQYQMFLEEMEQALKKNVVQIDTNDAHQITEHLRMKIQGTQSMDSFMRILRHLLIFTDVYASKFTLEETIELWKQVELSVERLIREIDNSSSETPTSSEVPSLSSSTQPQQLLLSPLLKKMRPHGRSFKDNSTTDVESVDETSVVEISSVAEEALQKKLIAQDETIQQLQSELKDKQEELELIKQAGESGVTSQVEKEKHEKEIERLQDKLKTIESENQTYQKIISVLEESKKKLKEKVKSLSSKPNESPIGTNQEFIKLKERAGQLELTITKLTTDNEKLKKQLESQNEKLKKATELSVSSVQMPPPPVGGVTTGGVPPPPGSTGFVPPPPGTGGEISSVPPPGSNGFVPPPPPGGDSFVPPPPGGGMTGGVPPPPGSGVPPPPGGGVPPPPGGMTGVPPPPGGGGVPMPPGVGMPPPPPGGGMMPPPPGGFAKPPNAMPALPKLPDFKSTAKLRAFHFSAIQNKNVNETIFSKFKIIDQTHTILRDLDTADFEEAFGIKASSATGGVGGGTTAEPKKEKITLVDGKRSHNISLQLGSLRGIPYPKLKQAILELDESVVTPNNISTIKQIVPTEEESQLCVDYEGDRDELQVTDLFFIEMHGIPKMVDRCEAWEFKMKFDEIVNGIEPVINNVRKACSDLENCDSFHRVLAVILTLGNFLNSSSKKVAYAFKMASLSKLGDTKAANGKSSLLTYLVKFIQEKYPDLENFYEGLTGVSGATRVAIGSVQDDIKQTNASINKLKTLYEQCSKDSVEGDKFSQIMGSFLSRVEERIRRVEGNYASMMNDLKNIAILFNEAETDLQKEPDKFFQLIDGFIKSFNDIKERLRKEREAEEKKKKKATTSTTPTATGKGAGLGLNTSGLNKGVRSPSSKTPQSPGSNDERGGFDKKGALLMKNADLLRKRRNTKLNSTDLDIDHNATSPPQQHGTPGIHTRNPSQSTTPSQLSIGAFLNKHVATSGSSSSSPGGNNQ